MRNIVKLVIYFTVFLTPYIVIGQVLKREPVQIVKHVHRQLPYGRACAEPKLKIIKGEVKWE